MIKIINGISLVPREELGNIRLEPGKVIYLDDIDITDRVRAAKKVLSIESDYASELLECLDENLPLCLDYEMKRDGFKISIKIEEEQTHI